MQRANNKRRLLFPSPSVIDGSEREPQVSDFESLSKRAIGEGAFGEVYKVRHRLSKNLYAIKVVSKQKVLGSNLLPQLRREIRIMYSLDHPHVIKLYNHFEDEKNFYLVLELAQGGTLWQRLAKFKSFDEDTAAQYLREVLLAVEYLHSRDPPIIHRDIKPENLLLDVEGREGRMKLADFGWSNFFNDDRTRMTYCGTLDYLAPEMINQQGHTMHLDIWNLGVLLFELLTGSAPFQASNQAAMFEKIQKVRISFPKNFPPLAKDLISRLLRANPAERLPLQEIANHPWMQTHSPIRPTITQQLSKEPLPCALDGGGDEAADILLEDPIKPFNANEYRVLSKPNEEVKQEIPQVEAEVSKKSEPTEIENQLRQTREENNKARTNLQTRESELDSVKVKIQELEANLQRLEQECIEKRDVEKQMIAQLAEKNRKVAELKAYQEDENKLYQEYEQLRAKCLEKETELNLLKNDIENLDKLTQDKNSQTDALESDSQRLKDEIETAKLRYNKNKTDMHDRLLRMNTDIDVMLSDLQGRGRDSSLVSLEALLTYAQENLEKIKEKSRVDSELLKQYQDGNERLVQMDNNQTEIQLVYDTELSDIKRKSLQESRSLEAGLFRRREDITAEHLEALKKRLQECMESPYSNVAIQEELHHMRNLIRYFEKNK